MNQIPKWKKDMYAAERESIKRLLVTFFSDYLTEDGLAETDYSAGSGMSETDKLFALAKLYFQFQHMHGMMFDSITQQSVVLAVKSCIDDMIEKHFKEESK